jgi:hypothetical protein
LRNKRGVCRAVALKHKLVFIPSPSPPKRAEQVLWIAVLSRAVLDVRHGSEEEALAVLGWIERDRAEFEQVITLAGLEAGHAERFERAVHAAFELRFRAGTSTARRDRSIDNQKAMA